MVSPTYFSRLKLAVILGVFLVVIGGCTREREPWPATPSIKVTPTRVVARTPTATSSLKVTVLPVRTPRVTISPKVDTQTEQKLKPLAGEEELPPIPGNEDLTPKPPTPTPKPILFTYTVKAGDTLYSIAEAYGISIEDIKRYNKIPNPNNLRVGQELQIPGKATAGSANSKSYEHVVKRGETLYGIAQEYGVPLDVLAKANDITDPSNIIVGQKLIIPNVAQKRGAGSSAGTGGSSTRVYVVKPGDTLTSIAARYGVKPQDIVKANDLEDPNRLVTGQTLKIPSP